MSYIHNISIGVFCKVADLEAHGPSDLLKDELTQSLEELEALLKAKDEVGYLLNNKEWHDTSTKTYKNWLFDEYPSFIL